MRISPQSRLSRPITDLKPYYDVIVVGSGYGGSIAASRLAQVGQAVCLLERGRELRPGEYPDTELLGLRELQVRVGSAHIGSKTAMFDMHVGPDVDVLIGCGLGGGSLINAGVLLRPEARVFEDPRWPKPFRENLDLLRPHCEAVMAMLSGQPFPRSERTPAKLRALEDAVPESSFHKPPLAVSFAGGVNAAGVFQTACTGCGDCCSGCNEGAKTTLLMTYLPNAVAHGAEAFTRVQARHIERAEQGWRVHFQLLEAGRDGYEPPCGFIDAASVVLAAGTLGSTEILLRSAANGLPVSDRLGYGFSGNGDAVGFVYDTTRPVHGIGLGPHRTGTVEPPGPCITGVVDRRNQPTLEEGLVVQDAVIPSVLAATLPALFAAGVPGEDLVRRAQTLLEGPYHGPLNRTVTLLSMGHDESAGRVTLKGDRLQIAWPGAAADPAYHRADAAMSEIARSMDGTYVADPLSSRLLGRRSITVHPLGGCCMADSAETGVVDAEGRVFAGPAGTALHSGLHVWDGSIVPRSLGVNPMLTISALAERAVALLIGRLGRRPVEAHTPPPPPVGGLIFTERMRGTMALGVTATAPETFEPTLRNANRAGPVDLVLTIVSDDLRAMLNSASHVAAIHGTMVAPLLSNQPMTILDGRFQLFGQDPDHVDVRRITYDFTARGENGECFPVHAFKAMRSSDIPRLWTETTTLYATVGDASRNGGVGVMRIAAADFIRQLATIEVTNASSESDRLLDLIRFGTFFAGRLFSIYGALHVAAGASVDGPVIRRRRPLRTGPGEPHRLRTPDGTDLLLTHYKGGGKGPVIVAPGFGVNTLSFSTDTVDTNLPEYLCGRGFDVWLFDYRASPLVACARHDFTIDDIALQDWPTAVDYVRGVTGADSVQVLGHCVGSMSFLMACLAGMTGVRSAICSQLTLHPVSWWVNDIKSRLHLARGMRAIGVASVDVNWHHSLLNDGIDQLLKLDPVPHDERCGNPVCRRIFALFGPSYKHAQLNDATHAAIHEMFGVVGATAFEHLSVILNKGHVVDHTGADVYMPHLDRLAFPILFVAGEDNQEFLPETSARTYGVLSERNGGQFYRRQVFPDYSHMDCFIGRTAAADIFPALASYLDEA